MVIADIAGAADRETAAAGEEGATGGEADVGEGRRRAVRRKLLRGAAAQRPGDAADAAVERAFRPRLQDHPSLLRWLRPEQACK